MLKGKVSAKKDAVELARLRKKRRTGMWTEEFPYLKGKQTLRTSVCPQLALHWQPALQTSARNNFRTIT